MSENDTTDDNLYSPISGQQFTEWLDTTAPHFICDTCSHPDFMVNSDGDGAPYILESGVRNWQTTWSFYFIVCENCGSTKFFSANVVNQAIKAFSNNKDK